MYRWKALALFIVLVFAVCTSVSAQSESTTKGNFILGGAMSWSSVDNELATDRTNTWNFIPTGMYFPADNVAVGLEIDFWGMTSGDDGVSTHRYFAVGQWVVPTSNAMVRPFLMGGGGFARRTVQSTQDIVFNGWGLKAGAGMYLFLNEHISITPQVAFIYESFGEDATTATTMGEDQTIYVGLGVSGFILP